MNQAKDIEPQVMYLGRWVKRNHFRVVVYSETAQKLVNSYDEYLKAIESGLWFSQKEDVGKESLIQLKPGRKPKSNDTPNATEPSAE